MCHYFRLLLLCFLLFTCWQRGDAYEHLRQGIVYDCEGESLSINRYRNSSTIQVKDLFQDSVHLISRFGVIGLQGAQMQLHLTHSHCLTQNGVATLDSLQSMLHSIYRLNLRVVIDSTNNGIHSNVFAFLGECDSTTTLRVSGQSIAIDAKLLHGLSGLSRCSFSNTTFTGRIVGSVPPVSLLGSLSLENCVVESEDSFSQLCDLANIVMLRDVRDSNNMACVPVLNTSKDEVIISIDCVQPQHFQTMSQWKVSRLLVFESCNKLFPTVLLDIEGIQGIVYRGQLTGFDDWSHIKYKDIALNLNGNQISDLNFGWEEHFAYNSLDNTLEDNPLSKRLVQELIGVHRRFKLPLGNWLLPYLEIRQK